MSSIRPTICSFGESILLLLLAAGVAPAKDRFEPDVLLEERPTIATDPFAPIAVAAETPVVAHWIRGRVVIRNEALEQQKAIEHEAKPRAMALNEQGNVVYTGDAKGVVRCLSVPAEKENWAVKLKGPIEALAVMPSFKLIAVASSKTMTLLNLKGETKGEVGIAPSALKRQGRSVPVLVALNATGQVAVIEKRSVRLIGVSRAGLSKKKSRTVKVPGSATCGSRVPGEKNLLVGTTSGLLRINPEKGKAKLLVKKGPSGAPVDLAAGGPFGAGLAKSRRKIVLFDRDKDFSPSKTFTFDGTIGERVVSTSRGQLYVVSRFKSADVDAQLDCLDGETGRLRGGVLPKGASHLRFLANGALSCLVWSDDLEDSSKNSVTVWSWSAAKGSRRVGAQNGDLVGQDSTACLVRTKDGLVILSRVDGTAKALAAPRIVDTDYSLQHGRFVIWAKGEQYVVWDGETDARLGAFSARSQSSLAISPDGAQVVRLTDDGSLVCESAAGDPLWATKAANASGAIEIGARGRSVNVVGLDVRSLDSGDVEFKTHGPQTQFSGTGKYLLQSQWDRQRVSAQIHDGETGQALWTLHYVDSGARVRTSVELIALDDSGRALVLRFHGRKLKGLWLYRRA